jgi:hypothetical protein
MNPKNYIRRLYLFKILPKLLPNENNTVKLLRHLVCVTTLFFQVSVVPEKLIGTWIGKKMSVCPEAGF